MASKSGFKSSGPRSFPKRGNMSSLQNYVIVKFLVKTVWGDAEGLLLLFWSVLFVSGMVFRWEDNEVRR